VTPLVQTRGAELGLRSELLHDVQSSLSFWRLDMDSELVFVGDAGTVEPSRPSRRYGVEWDAQWHPVRWLVFDVMLAWSHARFTGGAPDHIPGSIEWASSAGATLHELGPFRASLFMRYFGPRPLIEDDSVRSTASTLFNLQGSYDFTPWARLSLEVFNIFDAQVDDISYFYRSRLTGEPAAGVDDVHFHPATPRNFRVSAAFRW
jgi:outer membrane receptor protein involved in Fe transport